MKSFLKYTLATIVGIVIAVLVLFFIGVGMVSGLTSSKTPETVVDDNSVLLLDLNGTLSERVEENPIDLLLGADYESYGLDDILSAIHKAKENDRIKGIYIKATLFSASSASREEIRRALLDFKEAGKFIVAYGDTYTQGLYYLASVADKVLLNPQGLLEWRGLAAAPMFYKSLLDKVGVEMQVFKVGTYKSAVEPYLATRMSEANRQQVNAYLSSIWGKMVADVSASRGLSPEALNAAADSMMAFQPAETAVETGLVDTLMYQNDVRDYLKAMAGLDEDEELPLLDLEDMKGVKESRAKKKKSGDIIAVYYAFGELDLTSTYTTGEGINSQKVIKDLRKLKEDQHVKAVVLRVNSPGGSAYGAEQIWYAVNELKKEKPVVVSMGDYAASGGYYISCNADCIVAEATTLTGSIGIYGIFPNAKGLADKVGLDFDVVKTNRYADFGQLTRPMDDGEKALLQEYINRGYDLF
ncbi:MAG: signal peptide peptidase SppA, partial [Prevotellaceae bacterium]|nr:signal peptide peptidase SppA [Prevotellaceae bacterium]